MTIMAEGVMAQVGFDGATKGVVPPGTEKVINAAGKWPSKVASILASFFDNRANPPELDLPDGWWEKSFGFVSEPDPQKVYDSLATWQDQSMRMELAYGISALRDLLAEMRPGSPSFDRINRKLMRPADSRLVRYAWQVKAATDPEWFLRTLMAGVATMAEGEVFREMYPETANLAVSVLLKQAADRYAEKYDALDAANVGWQCAMLTVLTGQRVYAVEDVMAWQNLVTKRGPGRPRGAQTRLTKVPISETERLQTVKE